MNFVPLTKTKKDILKIGPPMPWLIRKGRVWMKGWLFFSDLLSIQVAGVLAVLMRWLITGLLDWHFYDQVLIVMALCMIAYIFNGLYPAVGIHPSDELRRLSLTTTFMVFSFAALTFWMKNALLYSRLTLGFTWIFSLVTVPVGRFFIRRIMSKIAYWGEPVAIIGSGLQGRWLVGYLRENPQNGMIPIVLIGSESAGVPLDDIEFKSFNEDEEDETMFDLQGVETALVLTSEVPEWIFKKLTGQTKGFKRIVLIPDIQKISSMGAVSFSIDSVLGIKVYNNLLKPFERFKKRLIDLLIVFSSAPIILPFLLSVMILVKITSRGPVFYSQVRLGKDLKKIKVWKFRSMVTNAEDVLNDFLCKSPSLRDEWLKNFKLKNDPRLTCIGKFLRRFSLDELPQLWNVLKGEMSIVGPRPRPQYEIDIENSSEAFEIFKNTLPGMTGLWQVSGRNEKGFDERVRLDEFYVRNWSIWLDIYIIACTFWVVITGKGAY